MPCNSRTIVLGSIKEPIACLSLMHMATEIKLVRRREITHIGWWISWKTKSRQIKAMPSERAVRANDL